MQSHTFDAAGVSLHYIEAPGEDPPVVIVHGLSGSHDEFVHLLPGLSPRARVYLLDLRGHGRSGRASSYRVADYARDVETFLREAVSTPAVLVGHSLGGLAAAHVAAVAPHLLSGVVLEDAGFYILQMPQFADSGFHGYFLSLRKYLDEYHAGGAGLERMVDYVGSSPAGDGRTMLDVVGSAAVEQRALQLHQMDPATLDPALDGTLMDSDPDELLKHIRCPALILAASPAAAMTEEDAVRASSNLPGSTYRLIEDSGHDIHLDQPEAFLSELLRFRSALAA